MLCCGSSNRRKRRKEKSWRQKKPGRMEGWNDGMMDKKTSYEVRVAS